VFVSCARSEGWNLPLIEAMACGTPVIAMKEGAVDEVIENGINGFKVNSVEEMIASAMKINQINRKECRQRAEDSFNVNRIANKYLSLFTLNQNKKIVLITVY
jgi:glycosyltransferase involved in cell wall biosynthesis